MLPLVFCVCMCMYMLLLAPTTKQYPCYADDGEDRVGLNMMANSKMSYNVSAGQLATHTYTLYTEYNPLIQRGNWRY